VSVFIAYLLANRASTGPAEVIVDQLDVGIGLDQFMGLGVRVRWHIEILGRRQQFLRLGRAGPIDETLCGFQVRRSLEDDGAKEVVPGALPRQGHLDRKAPVNCAQNIMSEQKAHAHFAAANELRWANA